MGTAEARRRGQKCGVADVEQNDTFPLSRVETSSVSLSKLASFAITSSSIFHRWSGHLSFDVKTGAFECPPGQTPTAYHVHGMSALIKQCLEQQLLRMSRRQQLRQLAFRAAHLSHLTIVYRHSSEPRSKQFQLSNLFYKNVFETFDVSWLDMVAACDKRILSLKTLRHL
ncbi:hypothetical protein ElyMa_002736300 [Elysia marginata]|uniref:Uncharacterized protein n=1 Tax=Elysia marginata TaxID=1093978 RepID=A0AAV4HFK3_9GAST|nr:hypothetical protein ElyMa_002736300 [Elysia marginata]